MVLSVGECGSIPVSWYYLWENVGVYLCLGIIFVKFDYIDVSVALFTIFMYFFIFNLRAGFIIHISINLSHSVILAFRRSQRK